MESWTKSILRQCDANAVMEDANIRFRFVGRGQITTCVDDEVSLRQSYELVMDLGKTKSWINKGLRVWWIYYMSLSKTAWIYYIGVCSQQLNIPINFASSNGSLARSLHFSSLSSFRVLWINYPLFFHDLFESACMWQLLVSQSSRSKWWSRKKITSKSFN